MNSFVVNRCARHPFVRIPPKFESHFRLHPLQDAEERRRAPGGVARQLPGNTSGVRRRCFSPSRKTRHPDLWNREGGAHPADPQWFPPPAFGGETQGGAGQLAGRLPTEPRPLPGGRGSSGACRTRRQDSPFAGKAASKIWNIPMLPPRQSPLIGSLMSARTINPSLRPSAREPGS